MARINLNQIDIFYFFVRDPYREGGTQVTCFPGRNYVISECTGYVRRNTHEEKGVVARFLASRCTVAVVSPGLLSDSVVRRGARIGTSRGIVQGSLVGLEIDAAIPGSV